jgi:hypothetical protein
MSLISLLAVVVVAVTGGTPSDRPMCDGPDADPWVVDFRDRTLAYSGVARFALERWGPPTACEGAVTTEFDGARFGFVRLTFADGVSVEVETMPIETSITAVRAADGFTDAAGVEGAVRAAAADIGLEIDWAAPEEISEGDETTRTFWDPESGLNASVAFVYRNGTLIEARISMAL